MDIKELKDMIEKEIAYINKWHNLDNNFNLGVIKGLNTVIKMVDNEEDWKQEALGKEMKQAKIYDNEQSGFKKDIYYQ